MPTTTKGSSGRQNGLYWEYGIMWHTLAADSCWRLRSKLLWRGGSKNPADNTKYHAVAAQQVVSIPRYPFPVGRWLFTTNTRVSATPGAVLRRPARPMPAKH